MGWPVLQRFRLAMAMVMGSFLVYCGQEAVSDNAATASAADDGPCDQATEELLFDGPLELQKDGESGHTWRGTTPTLEIGPYSSIVVHASNCRDYAIEYQFGQAGWIPKPLRNALSLTLSNECSDGIAMMAIERTYGARVRLTFEKTTADPVFLTVAAR